MFQLFDIICKSVTLDELDILTRNKMIAWIQFIVYTCF